MDWGEDAIERLRALWAEGHSTAEIGRRMGVTKNAVVGKAHRLRLPARPSPIRRDGTQPRAVSAGRRSTLPPIRVPAAVPVMGRVATASEAPRTVAFDASALRCAPVVAAAPRAARPATSVLARVAAVAPVARVVPDAAARPAISRAAARSCCWPIGEPGTPSFRFCTGEAIPTKPYCAEHAALAYVRVRDRREDAA